MNIDFDKLKLSRTYNIERAGSIDVHSNYLVIGDITNIHDKSDNNLKIDNITSGEWNVMIESTRDEFDVLASSNRGTRMTVYITHNTMNENLEWESIYSNIIGNSYGIAVLSKVDDKSLRKDMKRFGIDKKSNTPYYDIFAKNYNDSNTFFLKNGVLFMTEFSSFDEQSGPFISIQKKNDNIVNIKIELIEHQVHRESSVNSIYFADDVIKHKIDVNWNSINKHIERMKSTIDAIIDYYDVTNVTKLSDKLEKNIENIKIEYSDNKYREDIHDVESYISYLKIFAYRSYEYLLMYRESIYESIYRLLLDFRTDIWIHPNMQENYDVMIKDWNGIRNCLFRIRSYENILSNT